MENNQRKIRLGVFGCFRGKHLAKCAQLAGAEIVAACDKNSTMLDAMKSVLAEGGKTYDSFDEFIQHDMDGCILANYYSEHVPYAIRLLEKGIAVLSECAAATTMAECVQLVRAVEKSKAVYMLIENYPYSASCQELRRVYQEGKLGRVVMGEGEYVHPMSVAEHQMYAPTPEHWRNYIPATYYNTHAIGPLMYATEAMPMSVSARAVCRPESREGTFAKNDPYALMMCKMSDGSIFTFTGWAGIGGHGSWYRLACTNGIVETVRFHSSQIRIGYNATEYKEGEPKNVTYEPMFPYDADKAAQCGHSGGDYFVTSDFIKAIKGEKAPFFDVYRATAMASCGILGWRSCLEEGKTYHIPDFRKEEDRVLYENDTASPFLKPDGTNDIPTSVAAVEK